MKKILFITLLPTLLLISSNISSQNYNETLVPQYNLPDILQALSGNKVHSVDEWEKIQRPYLMNQLAEHIYGNSPTDKVKVKYQLLHENANALDDKATMQQIQMTFTKDEKIINALLLVYIPNQRKGRIPVFIGYNFKGNHTVSNDKEILYSPYFHKITNESDPRLVRGQQISRWPLSLIIDSGYAIATMCYCDIYPDHPNGESESILSLFPPKTQSNRGQAIASWAWGSSRIADWVEKQSWADSKRIAIMGHSRLGKAALWAGAQDTRFKVVISNNSGCGGAALSRREYGETIDIITKAFPHWFCPNFNNYAKNVNTLPVDQHTLIAMMAPRHVYIASAVNDKWADPRGEYLAAYYASPIYSLYGLKGIQTPVMPKQHQPVMNNIGYHIRAGEHNVKEYDWKCYIDFCNNTFKN